MKYSPSLAGLALLTALMATATQASEIETKLMACSNNSDATARLACFDSLAAQLGSEKDSSSEAADPPQAASVPESLPDSIGGGAFADAAGEQEKSYAGRVTSCKKSSDRRWFYFFDNGQVWKQVDRRKRRHKDCNFDVTLKEDSFGYVMQIAGEKGAIRVDRRR